MGHIGMAILIALALFAIIIIITSVPADIPPLIQNILVLLMPVILIFGLFNWGLSIFINKKVSGFITLSLVIIFGFGVYNGWLDGIIDILSVQDIKILN